jgi:hypothetical protein
VVLWVLEECRAERCGVNLDVITTDPAGSL